jgi:hypothetical protein
MKTSKQNTELRNKPWLQACVSRLTKTRYWSITAGSTNTTVLSLLEKAHLWLYETYRVAGMNMATARSPENTGIHMYIRQDSVTSQKTTSHYFSDNLKRAVQFEFLKQLSPVWILILYHISFSVRSCI